jgi:hypothetical protein
MADAPALGAILALVNASCSAADATEAELCASRTHGSRRRKSSVDRPSGGGSTVTEMMHGDQDVLEPLRDLMIVTLSSLALPGL